MRKLIQIWGRIVLDKGINPNMGERFLSRLHIGFQVPLFQHMDELVLENICDRVKSLIFTKEETVSYIYSLKNIIN